MSLDPPELEATEELWLGSAHWCGATLKDILSETAGASDNAALQHLDGRRLAGGAETYVFNYVLTDKDDQWPPYPENFKDYIQGDLPYAEKSPYTSRRWLTKYLNYTAHVVSRFNLILRAVDMTAVHGATGLTPEVREFLLLAVPEAIDTIQHSDHVIWRTYLSHVEPLLEARIDELRSSIAAAAQSNSLGVLGLPLHKVAVAKIDDFLSGDLPETKRHRAESLAIRRHAIAAQRDGAPSASKKQRPDAPGADLYAGAVLRW